MHFIKLILLTPTSLVCMSENRIIWQYIFPLKFIVIRGTYEMWILLWLSKAIMTHKLHLSVFSEFPIERNVFQKEKISHLKNGLLRNNFCNDPMSEDVKKNVHIKNSWIQINTKMMSRHVLYIVILNE